MIRKYAALVKDTGLVSTLQYLLYQFGIKSGLYKRLTPALHSTLDQIPDWIPDHLPDLPIVPDEKLLMAYLQADQFLLADAGNILSGKFRAFGRQLEPINLEPDNATVHWTKVSDSGEDCIDIKLIWEPARFGWAFTLSRAYQLTGVDRYAACFWQQFETFTKYNPVNCGPNWASAQEVSLRLINLSLSALCLRNSPESTPDRLRLFNSLIVQHTRRILPTIIYAKAQNNNHLLSEAAGLYTAGTLCRWHPDAGKWRKQGLQIFDQALIKQIDEHGEYVQHSTNYHRLMLHLALWMHRLTVINEESLNISALSRISTAINWLLEHTDSFSGKAVNLGHNDGTNLFDLSSCQYSDYRPVLQACSTIFCQKPLFEAGPWDELSVWMGAQLQEKSKPIDLHASGTANQRLVLDKNSWASMRVAKYKTRPAHADQLHVELWWRGINLATDPGTYRYTALAPWQNALRASMVHNTLTVDRLDQMQSISRFRWINWAQADLHVYDRDKLTVVASHNGYHQKGITHTRTLKGLPHKPGWQITDRVISDRAILSPITLYVHWLLPDLPYRIDGNSLSLYTSAGTAELNFSCDDSVQQQGISVYRSGKQIFGESVVDQPLLGWYSDTYNHKVPALSIEFRVTTDLPVNIFSDWTLRAENPHHGQTA